MSVIGITNKCACPLSLGTPPFAKSQSGNYTPSSSFPLPQSASSIPLKEKNILDLRPYLQPGAQLPSSNNEFLFRERILPDELIKFFADHPLPSSFNPYLSHPDDPIHLQLKKVANYFEEFTQACPTMGKTSIAEEIIAEIRHAKVITYFQEHHSHLTVPEKILILEEREKTSREDFATSVFTELGARYHLTCRLFKIQSRLAQTNLTDIASIYNFMTLKNTFVPHRGCLHLARHVNLMGPLTSNRIEAKLKLSRSLNDTLKWANQLVHFHIKALKDKIIKGCIASFVEEEDRVLIEGQWREPNVCNASISSMLKCVESVLRQNLARKIITSIGSQYKKSYQKTGQLPKEIPDTIEKITVFLKSSSKTKATHTQLEAHCDPSRDLLSGIFGPSPDFSSLLNEVEKQTHKPHKEAPFWSRFYNLFQAHDKIDCIKAKKRAALSWAKKQWNSPVPLAYPLPSLKRHAYKPQKTGRNASDTSIVTSQDQND